MKVPVAVDDLPMRITPDSPATPGAPISMLLLPVVRFMPAVPPTPMLNEPVVVVLRAPVPMAVFRKPVMFRKSAFGPVAVLWLRVYC
jgi:hypothetical protein